MKIINLRNLFFFGVFIALIAITFFVHFRVDLTSDKRYSLAKQTKDLMASVDEPLKIMIYLDGELNPGFERLKKSTSELIEELGIYSGKSISVQFENPSIANSQQEREQKYTELQAKGLIPTAVYERDKEGKSIQKIIFPWMEISYKDKKVAISLLKNIRGNSGEQNLNISIENLEFEITDGIRRLTTKEVTKIAFLEGHGELTEPETYDISKSLSKYFQIDRGVIATDASVLDNYKVIIIAKPTLPFSENDKYVIDQYIMNGGRVLWFVDGVRIAKESLSTTGFSPAMELDLNLNDQLFKYGVRINPVILQDVQCTTIPVNIAPANTNPQFEPSPWYYSPLLLTSGMHPISRNISEVKADFCSGIDVVGENKQVKTQFLLATSNNSHIVGTPSTIDLSQTPKPADKAYFNTGYLPVAVALEGNFDSDFTNRMPPKGLSNVLPIREKSVYTRQIVVADGDIIRNETNGIASDSTIVPLGYDRYMNQQFGNKDFVLNAVLYLADNDGWMDLRNRTLKMRLLNKTIAYEEKTNLQLINTLFPLLLLTVFGVIFQFVRKRKYQK